MWRIVKSIELVCRVAIVCAASQAWCQVGVPGVPVPSVPVQGLPVDVDRTTRTAVSRLAEARKIRVDQLLRAHRDRLERDPNGEPIVRSELIAIAPSDGALAAALAKGYTVLRREQIEGLGLSTVVLRAPPDMSTRRALRDLERLDPDGSYDFNHLYLGSAGDASPMATVPAIDTIAAAVDDESPRIGMIDTGVDVNHPVFVPGSVVTWGCEEPLPDSHGTSVASLLVAASADFRGAAPAARLFAADVYCNQPVGGAADSLALAFGWLVGAEVGVINVSLVGPTNRLIERVVRQVLARGHLVVAAVGNDGPTAPPRFPAGYANVTGVTAVDRRQRVLIEACRGAHVDFAAPGADMAAAEPGGRYAAVRGTSFAAPVAAGLLAQWLPGPSLDGARAALANLTALAEDLGPRGADRTYGVGLVGAALRVEPARVQAQ